MSVILARASLDTAQKAVAVTRRRTPDSPLSRAALAAAWDARCALRRAIDAATRGDERQCAQAGEDGRLAAMRASEIASLAEASMAVPEEVGPTGGCLSPSPGIALVPGSPPAARQSMRA